MNEAARYELELRLLVLASNSQDAQHSRLILDDAGIAITLCRNLYELCREAAQGAGALLITDEAFADERFDHLREMLRAQPAWSDLPLLILAPGGVSSTAAGWAMEALANVVLLDRPVQAPALIAAVRSALRARTHQIQLRDHIEEEGRIQRALRDTEQRFAAFMNHLPGAAWIKDLQGRYLYANPAAQRIFGKSHTEIAGKTDEEIFPPDTAHQFRANDGHALVEGYVQTMETLREPDGFEHHSIVTKFAIAGVDGKTACIGGVASDITERETIEQALRRSEQRRAGIIDSAMDAIITVDEKQRIVLFNPAAELMFRCREGEALDEPLERFIPQRYREVHSEHVENFGRTGSTTRAMGHMRALAAVRADGEEFPIEASISQVQIGGHRLFTVILRDVTERKRQDDALEAALARAEQASTAKDHFLAVLSHELRNPLAPITTGVEILRRKLTHDQQGQKTINVIGRNVELQARLIDDLLDMTRIVRGKVELDRQPVAVGQILQRVAEVCMPDIEARGLYFGMKIDQPPHFINADAARMQQVFWNLLKNSVKFTPRGGCVGVWCWRQENQVIVEVLDSGEGIEPEAIRRIFNPFEQADRAVTRRFGGVGLGLSISKALVEMHGGSIEARSSGKGQGATFTVRLPLGEQREQTQGTGADERIGAAKPLRILLVEDHGDTANLMQEFLALDGHNVELAGDVASAIELAQQHCFDLLISDLGLPDASGLDLIRELRARGYTGPGIALSGFGLEQDIVRSKEAGFDAHVTKPASLERLSRLIAELTEGEPRSIEQRTRRLPLA
jgi:two-component system, chemotaxis family, CheB/CheR fusion protein